MATDLIYGQFAQRRFQICVEDVAYDWTPSKFARIDGEDGVLGNSVKTLDLSRKVILPKPVNELPMIAYDSQSAVFSSGSTPTDYHPNPRYLVQQAWRAEWDNAYIDLCLRDHLYTLYTLQKPFWIQFDDEMSFDCVAMEPLDANRTQYVTPTYPVAFYRSSDPEGARQVEHAYFQVYFNGSEAKWDDNPWRFDSEIGLLIFQNPVPSDIIVSIRYLWRAYVRIRELNFTIAAYAQGPYTGFVEFEQVQVPNVVERFDDRMSKPPCRRCPDNKYSDGTDSEECVEYVGPAVVSNLTRIGQASTWQSTDNAKFDDATYTTVALASDTKSAYLHATQFNFSDLPKDEIERKISHIYVVAELYASSSDLNIDEVRLTKNNVVIGSNAATLESLSIAPTKFLFVFDTRDYGITYDDIDKARVGVAIGVTSFSRSAQTAALDFVSMAVCYEEGIDDLPPLVDCGCNTTDRTSTSTIYEQTCLTLKWYERKNGFDIPTSHYVHGVEIMSMTAGVNNGCPPFPATEASIKAKLRLNRSGSTFSSWLTKSTQPVSPTNHATVGYLDATTDPSFGGANDLWGRPFGAWTPAMVNNDGLEFDINWEADCNPQDPANWEITYVYDGITEHSAGQPGDPISFAWGQSPQGGIREYSRGTGAPNYVSLSGTIKIVYTWVGVGDPPTFMQASVYSRAVATCLDGPGANYWEGKVNNGFADSTNIEYQAGFEISREQEGTHTVLLNVEDGVAEYVVSCSAYSFKSQPTSDGLQVYGSVQVTGTVADCTLPSKQDVVVRVHHSPVCATRPMCYQNATETGTWNRPHSKGINCGLAQTSDGSTNGEFTLDMFDFSNEVFKANTRIVGILVTGEYRRVGSGLPSGSITLKTHIGAFNEANIGKTLDYPTTDVWTNFTVGGNGDFWDYQATYAETGVDYPTALGSQINSYLHLQMLGSNVTNTFFEFRNIKLTIYFAEVCDGL